MVRVVAERWVVDTSVFVRWYLRQPGWEQARTLRDDFLAARAEISTVECARFELPHVLRRMGYLRGLLTREDCIAAARTIDDLEIRVTPMDVEQLEAATILALDHQVSFFDGVFVHAALRADGRLATADQGQAQLANGLGVETLLVGRP